MENEISGGEKRYKHQQYGLGVIIDKDLLSPTVRFHRKSWVPRWLWNLLATPDGMDLLEVAISRCSIQTEERIATSLHGGERTRG